MLTYHLWVSFTTTSGSGWLYLSTAVIITVHLFSFDLYRTYDTKIEGVEDLDLHVYTHTYVYTFRILYEGLKCDR